MNSILIRDLLIIPLVVGVIVALLTFGLPFIFGEGKELSFAIEDPTPYPSDFSIGKDKIFIDSVGRDDLIGYEVKIWNSGDVPLKQLAIWFVFEQVPADFRILNIIHQSKQFTEFGAIQEEMVGPGVRRFTYQILAPNDEHSIIFLVNDYANLNVFTKSEGLIVQDTTHSEDSLVRRYAKLLVPLMAILSAFLGVSLSIFQRTIIRRRKID